MTRSTVEKTYHPQVPQKYLLISFPESPTQAYIFSACWVWRSQAEGRTGKACAALRIRSAKVSPSTEPKRRDSRSPRLSSTAHTICSIILQPSPYPGSPSSINAANEQQGDDRRRKETGMERDARHSVCSESAGMVIVTCPQLHRPVIRDMLRLSSSARLCC